MRPGLAARTSLEGRPFKQPQAITSDWRTANFMDSQPSRSAFPHPSANNISAQKLTKQTKFKRLICAATMFKPQKVSREVPSCTSTSQWSMWSGTIFETRKSCSKQALTLTVEQSATTRWFRWMTYRPRMIRNHTAKIKTVIIFFYFSHHISFLEFLIRRNISF